MRNLTQFISAPATGRSVKLLQLPILLLLSLLLQLGCSSQQAAQPQHILLVAASEDARFSANTLQRLVSAAQNQFNQAGHKAFDLTAISGLSRQQQAGLSRAAALDLARSSRSPALDALLYYSPSVVINDASHRWQLKVSLDGSLIAVGSGRLLGSSTMQREQSLAPDCRGRCAEEAAAELLRQLAQDTAAALVSKLGTVRPGSRADSGSSGYNLVFNNFTASQLSAIEQGLSQLTGYQSHRPGYLSHTRAEYWYQSRMGSAALKREVQQLLAELGLRASLQFSGNSLQVEQITLRPAPASDYQW